MKRFGLIQFVSVLCALFLVTCEASSSEVYALNSFKEAIYEDPNLVLLDWNALEADPCDWYGISCSPTGDHVSKLNVSGSSLRGFLAPELGLLSYLQEINLHGNSLISSIPKEIGMLKYLTVLDLGMNQLSGPIPPEIGGLTSLVKINLESNGLTGYLPSELGNLMNLEELRIDRNKLQGTFPASNSSNFSSGIHGMSASSWNITGLCRSPRLKVADFSYNFFVGSIPKCLEYLPKVSFQGNCLEIKDLKQRSAAQCASTPPVNSRSEADPNHRPIPDKNKPVADGKAVSASKPTWILTLEIVTGTVVGVVFLVALFSAFRRCRTQPSIIIPWKKSASNKENMAIALDTEMLKDIQKYNRPELEVACEDFSNIIGSSLDCVIYKGNIKGGPEIAVISLGVKEENWTGYLELYFQKEVADLARITHENTGKLLGYCRESSPFTRMLVFEYASNGTLYEYLHSADGEGSQLSWTRRMKIIIGIARGLGYLQTELDPPFIISELNSNAVYLTEDFSPKLVDFESWKLILSRSEKDSGSTSGSSGPICVLPNSIGRHLDVQENIYAFGVLLLEIVSGRPPYTQEQGCLVDWAKDFLEVPEVMPYAVDPLLKHFQYDDLKVICEVVSLCIHSDISKRPNMQDVFTMLDSRIDLSISAELQASSLVWAELALSSN